MRKATPEQLKDAARQLMELELKDLRKEMANARDAAEAATAQVRETQQYLSSVLSEMRMAENLIRENKDRVDSLSETVARLEDTNTAVLKRTSELERFHG